jgi:hypothetical protein
MREYLLLALCTLIGAAGTRGQEVTRSTKDDQRGIALTVYNVNLGLVKEEREISIGAGLTTLQFMDVAASIDPTSVHIRSLEGTPGFTVLEQNFEYDLLSPGKMLDKYVGRDVSIEERDPETGRMASRTAKILSTQGGLVYEFDGKISFDFMSEEGFEGKRIIFPEIPPDLVARPTLVWLLDGKRAGKERVEASYLTNDISWRADYVIVVGEKDDVADMNAWVTIENNSGAAYRDAELKLVAGDVQRVTEERPQLAKGTDRLAEFAAVPQFEEEPFFEYHLYTLDRKATLRDQEKKQLSLLQASGVPVMKKFMSRTISPYMPVRPREESPPVHAGVYLELENKAANGLGMPLPRGTVRVYKKDRKGALQFIGEDRIDHTPKDEKITIRMGEAFDVVTERIQTSFEKVSKTVTERSYEISIRNHKEERIQITLVEPVSGDWKITTSSHPYEKVSAREVRFTVPVEAGGETVVTYTIRVTF